MPISKKPNSKAQLISFIGEGTPTLERGVWLASEGRTDIVAFDALDLERLVPHVDRHWSKVDGDGTLSKSSQRMPSALLAVADHEIVLKDNHLDILERPEVLSTLEDMLS